MGQTHSYIEPKLEPSGNDKGDCVINFPCHEEIFCSIFKPSVNLEDFFNESTVPDIEHFILKNRQIFTLFASDNYRELFYPSKGEVLSHVAKFNIIDRRIPIFNDLIDFVINRSQFKKTVNMAPLKDESFKHCISNYKNLTNNIYMGNIERANTLKGCFDCFKVDIDDSFIPRQRLDFLKILTVNDNKSDDINSIMLLLSLSLKANDITYFVSSIPKLLKLNGETPINSTYRSEEMIGKYMKTINDYSIISFDLTNIKTEVLSVPSQTTASPESITSDGQFVYCIVNLNCILVYSLTDTVLRKRYFLKPISGISRSKCIGLSIVYSNGFLLVTGRYIPPIIVDLANFTTKKCTNGRELGLSNEKYISTSDGRYAYLFNYKSSLLHILIITSSSKIEIIKTVQLHVDDCKSKEYLDFKKCMMLTNGQTITFCFPMFENPRSKKGLFTRTYDLFSGLFLHKAFRPCSIYFYSMVYDVKNSCIWGLSCTQSNLKLTRVSACSSNYIDARSRLDFNRFYSDKILKECSSKNFTITGFLNLLREFLEYLVLNNGYVRSTYVTENDLCFRYVAPSTDECIREIISSINGTFAVYSQNNAVGEWLNLLIKILGTNIYNYPYSVLRNNHGVPEYLTSFIVGIVKVIRDNSLSFLIDSIATLLERNIDLLHHLSTENMNLLLEFLLESDMPRCLPCLIGYTKTYLFYSNSSNIHKLKYFYDHVDDFITNKELLSQCTLYYQYFSEILFKGFQNKDEFVFNMASDIVVDGFIDLLTDSDYEENVFISFKVKLLKKWISFVLSESNGLYYRIDQILKLYFSYKQNNCIFPVLLYGSLEWYKHLNHDFTSETTNLSICIVSLFFANVIEPIFRKGSSKILLLHFSGSSKLIYENIDISSIVSDTMQMMETKQHRYVSLLLHEKESRERNALLENIYHRYPHVLNKRISAPTKLYDSFILSAFIWHFDLDDDFIIRFVRSTLSTEEKALFGIIIKSLYSIRSCILLKKQKAEIDVNRYLLEKTILLLNSDKLFRRSIGGNVADLCSFIKSIYHDTSFTSEQLRLAIINSGHISKGLKMFVDMHNNLDDKSLLFYRYFFDKDYFSIIDSSLTNIIKLFLKMLYTLYDNGDLINSKNVILHIICLIRKMSGASGSDGDSYYSQLINVTMNNENHLFYTLKLLYSEILSHTNISSYRFDKDSLLRLNLSLEDNYMLRIMDIICSQSVTYEEPALKFFESLYSNYINGEHSTTILLIDYISVLLTKLSCAETIILNMIRTIGLICLGRYDDINESPCSLYLFGYCLMLIMSIRKNLSIKDDTMNRVFDNILSGNDNIYLVGVFAILSNMLVAPVPGTIINEPMHAFLCLRFDEFCEVPLNVKEASRRTHIEYDKIDSIQSIIPYKPAIYLNHNVLQRHYKSIFENSDDSRDMILDLFKMSSFEEYAKSFPEIISKYDVDFSQSAESMFFNENIEFEFCRLLYLSYKHKLNINQKSVKYFPFHGDSGNVIELLDPVSHEVIGAYGSYVYTLPLTNSGNISITVIEGSVTLSVVSPSILSKNVVYISELVSEDLNFYFDHTNASIKLNENSISVCSNPLLFIRSEEKSRIICLLPDMYEGLSISANVFTRSVGAPAGSVNLTSNLYKNYFISYRTQERTLIVVMHDADTTSLKSRLYFEKHAIKALFRSPIVVSPKTKNLYEANNLYTCKINNKPRNHYFDRTLFTQNIFDLNDITLSQGLMNSYLHEIGVCLLRRLKMNVHICMMDLNSQQTRWISDVHVREFLIYSLLAEDINNISYPSKSFFNNLYHASPNSYKYVSLIKRFLSYVTSHNQFDDFVRNLVKFLYSASLTMEWNTSLTNTYVNWKEIKSFDSRLNYLYVGSCLEFFVGIKYLLNLLRYENKDNRVWSEEKLIIYRILFNVANYNYDNSFLLKLVSNYLDYLAELLPINRDDFNQSFVYNLNIFFAIAKEEYFLSFKMLISGVYSCCAKESKKFDTQLKMSSSLFDSVSNIRASLGFMKYVLRPHESYSNFPVDAFIYPWCYSVYYYPPFKCTRIKDKKYMIQFDLLLCTNLVPYLYNGESVFKASGTYYYPNNERKKIEFNELIEIRSTGCLKIFMNIEAKFEKMLFVAAKEMNKSVPSKAIQKYRRNFEQAVRERIFNIDKEVIYSILNTKTDFNNKFIFDIFSMEYNTDSPPIEYLVFGFILTKINSYVTKTDCCQICSDYGDLIVPSLKQQYIIKRIKDCEYDSFTLLINREIAYKVRENKSGAYEDTILSQMYKGIPKGVDVAKMKGCWSVKFVDESPVDQGGVFRELLSEVSKELRDPNSGIVLPVPDYTSKKGKYWNTFLPVDNPLMENWEGKYMLIGQIIAYTFKTFGAISLFFPPLFWEFLITKDVSIERIYEIDPEFQLFMNSIEDAACDYNLSSDDFLSLFDCRFTTRSMCGQEMPVILDDSSKRVTKENAFEYTYLCKKFRIGEITKSLLPIYRGFHTIGFRDVDVSSMLRWQDLRLFICGVEKISYVEFTSLLIYEDNFPDSKKEQLFQVVKLLTSSQLFQLYKFATGYDVISLTSPQCISVCQSDFNNMLPTASTCNFKLYYPNYKSVHEAFEFVSTAIKHSDTFGLK